MKSKILEVSQHRKQIGEFNNQFNDLSVDDPRRSFSIHLDKRINVSTFIHTTLFMALVISPLVEAASVTHAENTARVKKSEFSLGTENHNVTKIGNHSSNTTEMIHVNSETTNSLNSSLIQANSQSKQTRKHKHMNWADRAKDAGKKAVDDTANASNKALDDTAKFLHTIDLKLKSNEDLLEKIKHHLRRAEELIVSMGNEEIAHIKKKYYDALQEHLNEAHSSLKILHSNLKNIHQELDGKKTRAKSSHPKADKAETQARLERLEKEADEQQQKYDTDHMLAEKIPVPAEPSSEETPSLSQNQMTFYPSSKPSPLQKDEQNKPAPTISSPLGIAR